MNINYFPHVKTHCIPPFPKRWPISTIFTPENMHAIIVPHSLPLSYHFRHRFHTTFVLPEIPQSAIYQPIPQIPAFPTFPAFPAFPAFPTFPTFPTIPKKIIHPQCPTHPQPRSARGDGAARVTKWRAVPLGSTTRPNF